MTMARGECRRAHSRVNGIDMIMPLFMFDDVKFVCIKLHNES